MNGYREIIRPCEGFIDRWITSEREREEVEKKMGDSALKEFIERCVWKDSDTGKWRFMEKSFKRQGQAVAACIKYFNNCCKGEK